MIQNPAIWDDDGTVHSFLFPVPKDYGWYFNDYCLEDMWLFYESIPEELKENLCKCRLTPHVWDCS